MKKVRKTNEGEFEEYEEMESIPYKSFTIESIDKEIAHLQKLKADAEKLEEEK